MSACHKQNSVLRIEAASPPLGQSLPQDWGLCPLPDLTHHVGPENSLSMSERADVPISQGPSCWLWAGDLHSCTGPGVRQTTAAPALSGISAALTPESQHVISPCVSGPQCCCQHFSRQHFQEPDAPGTKASSP